VALADLVTELEAAQVPVSPITPARDVADIPELAPSLLYTVRPDGRRVRLPPPAVEPGTLPADRTFPFPPRYGEHTDAVLDEVGVSAEELARLRGAGVIA
jgi:crotonobetainyl-CoA:carnitine CoA-transferase CaiB-like acyl-CoA transferase